MSSDDPHLNCPLCGQAHRAPALRPGQRAVCVRCGNILAEAGRLGPQAPLAFALTGLCLAVPALTLPFVVLSKFGKVRTVLLSDAAQGFWTQGYQPFGAAVLFCGALAPFGLLALLVAILLTDRRGSLRATNLRLRRWSQGVEYWAMPEVQVLGVLVAFFKLGSVVDVAIGPGLVCYGGASLFTLLAWRSFKLRPRPRKAAPALAPVSP
jgi:paraquat-inducible protein A